MRKILGIAIIFMGVLLYLFFRNYSGTLLAYPTLWFFVGLTFVIIGIWLLLTVKSDRLESVENKVLEEILELKLKGNKINIDFKDCEILSNHFYKEVPASSNTRIQAWDALYGHSKAIEHIEINQSRIACKVIYLFEEMVFMSPVIPKDKITLSFLLDKYKSTTIYVDKSDPDRFYFDLEFLDAR